MSSYDWTSIAPAPSRGAAMAAETDVADGSDEALVLDQSGLMLRMRSVSDPAPVDGSRVNGLSKRMFDFTLALVGLVFLLPLLVGVAILIKLTSPGPVFFRQQREGLGGRRFELYKFRSMRSEPGALSAKGQAADEDQRITPLGSFLRKTSMDELPQLINVFRGDMSLVGSRPHVPDMRVAGGLYQEVVPYYHLRANVRPGLTGWAQVNGLRGPIPEQRLAADRINHDLAYIQNWSLVLDCRILLRTLWREFSGGTGS